MIKCKKTLKTNYCIYTTELIKPLKMTNKSLFIVAWKDVYDILSVEFQNNIHNMVSFFLDHCFFPYMKTIVKANMKSASFTKM